mmetsp:Transcript_26489/g.40975  ORF Transcript_26489/g.40975 Transcript_26489/m.40975 type:complete len:651 (-) Transcript_26489:54-2006(-)
MVFSYSSLGFLYCLILVAVLLLSGGSVINNPYADVVSAYVASVAEDPFQCTLYLAESTIPSAGIGLFAGIDRPAGSIVSPPEIAHQILDGTEDFYNSLSHLYDWDGAVSGGTFEAEKVVTIMPGMGMVANSFLPLKNSMPYPARVDSAGSGRTGPGAGAFSVWHDQTYKTEVDLVAGAELFVDYGESYFTEQRGLAGVPFLEDFKWADRMISDLVRAGVALVGDTAWWAIKDAFVENIRRLGALPTSAADLVRAGQVGSVENYLGGNNPRSLDWLATNGYCVDNLQVRRSDLPDAGRGAFARKAFAMDDVLLPLPLLQLRRRDLVTDENSGTTNQLLLNYCFGDADSSMVLFPYSSTSNFINHSGEHSNARLQWPESDPTNFHQEGWLAKSVEDILSQKHAGLMLHVVATREIFEGEEVTINYGKTWEDAWEKHLQEWSPPAGDEPGEYVSASDLNVSESRLKTVFEQAANNYPENVATVCYYRYDRGEEEEATKLWNSRQRTEETLEVDGNRALRPGFDSAVYLARLNRTLPTILQHAPAWRNFERVLSGVNARPCKVIMRHSTEDEGAGDRYLVRMYNRWNQQDFSSIPTNQVEHYVAEVPRHAIHFVDRPYTSDQHLKGAFRHEMNFPDDMFPVQWRDGYKSCELLS